MKVILFGATGMVGQGVLRELLLDPGVEKVLAVGRSEVALRHDKLRQLVRSDLFDLGPVEAELQGYDACFFCLGVSAAGMSESSYRHLTYDLTVSIASLLVRLNAGMAFVYVSGAGTDSTERGRAMWARVKGQTENALLAMPFRAKFMFRPGFIQPLHGARSRTTAYRIAYAVLAPLAPLMRALFPQAVLTTEEVGRAMLAAVERGAPKEVLEVTDIIALGRR